MGWAKLDDAFPTNPKVVGLSDRAFRCYIIALCYAAQHMTDGFLPIAWVSLIVPRKQRQQLEVAGLWEPVEGGWVIHDYLTYNPTREQAEERRENQRAQRSAAGKARAATSQRAAGRFASGQPAKPLAPATSPVPSRPVPTGVGVDPEPDTPIAEGNIADAPSTNGKGKDGAPFFLADVVNLGLVTSLIDRYRRRNWDKAITPGLLTGLVLGSEDHDLPACGARAVNAAIDDLYANAATTKNPAAYLKQRAVAHAEVAP